jgi:nucleoside phosphorylase
LEYDTAQESVIMPGWYPDMKLPEKAVLAFLGDTVERYGNAYGQVIAEFETITKTFPVYRVLYRGQEICLCQAPLGSAAAAQFLDWLIGHGVKGVISAGSCGALVEMEENAFLVPIKALRDEGRSVRIQRGSGDGIRSRVTLFATGKEMKEV